MAESKARVQGEGRRLGRTPQDIPDGYIDWDEHHQAWEVYSRRWSGQSSEEIEARGGFGYYELKNLLGRPPQTWVPRDAERFKDFQLAEEDRPGYEEKVLEASVSAAPKMHILYVGGDRPICKNDSEVPDGPIAFDIDGDGHCSNCLGRLINWIDWWTRS